MLMYVFKLSGFRSFFAKFICVLIALLNHALAGSERPNILWITSEDNGAQWLSVYGSPNAKTPNLDRMAEEGFRYTHCFDNAAVCAPTRSLWITGVHAVSTGTEQMRSRYEIPHDLIPYWPDQIVKAGYLATNKHKTDYNIGGRADEDPWRGSRGKANWTSYRENQPFAAVMNITFSHESSLHPKKKQSQGLTDSYADRMVLHPYHPDLPAVRSSYSKYAQAVEKMDHRVGRILQELEENALAESTIVIYCSDHGGALPRGKRFLFNSGTHCPLIIRIPEKFRDWWPAEKPGMTVDRLVSFIDLPKTILSLTQAEIPPAMQGRIFLGDGIEPEPEYHFSYRGRADKGAVDMVRGVRDKEFLYIKNYMPWAPRGQYLPYMWEIEATSAWHDHYKAGQCSSLEARFFEPRVVDELYDHENDYHNINNLAAEPAQKARIERLRHELRQQQLANFDAGLIPEQMRKARAEAHGLTIYEMVRQPDLYPLERYLDYSDMVLAGDARNLPQLIEGAKDADPAIRYWSACGFAYLGVAAESADKEIETLTEEESIEVKIMALFALARSQGQTERVLKRYDALLLQAEQEGKVDQSDYISLIYSLQNLLTPDDLL